MRSLLRQTEDCLVAFIKAEGAFIGGVNYYSSLDALSTGKSVPSISILAHGSSPALSELGYEDGGTNRKVMVNVIIHTDIHDVTDSSNRVFTPREFHDELVSAVFNLFQQTDIADVLRGYAAASYGFTKIEPFEENIEPFENGYRTTLSTEVWCYANV